MSKRILILGNGFIASEFSRSYSPYLYNFDPESLANAAVDSLPEYIGDFSNIKTPLITSKDDKVFQYCNKIPINYQDIVNVINQYQPDVVINCIGKTGKPNVDWCETHQFETVEANLTFPSLLAEICHKKNIHLIHIGSGCINFGKSPHAIGSLYEPGWKETDSSNPESFYSKVKYAADLVLSGYDNVTIFRIRMPISCMPNPRNLITKLLNYKKVIQIPNSMTFTKDVLYACKWAIDHKKFGIYNLASPNSLTAFDIVKEYKKHRQDHDFELMSLKELSYAVSAPRSNCILDVSKIQDDGFKFCNVTLQSCINDYIENEKILKEKGKL